jgi:hypothetical protein
MLHGTDDLRRLDPSGAVHGDQRGHGLRVQGTDASR